ncbi:MAG TPA: class I SAM-dependent methyltransferase [Rhodanobacteraceae bacterium]
MEDRALPTLADAAETHAHFPRWPGIAPLPNARMMLHVGAETVENFLVVADAWGQLIASELAPHARVLDIGCGCARTARTLLHHPWIDDYLGIDVIAPYIAWNARFITPLTGGRFHFAHLDVRTPRYNPEGAVAAEAARYPLGDGAATLAFAASLFTHLREAAAQRYLDEAARCVAPGGKLIASIHDKPAPGTAFSGDEFRADVRADYFIALAARSGWEAERTVGDVCGQETLIFRRA